MWGMDRGGGNQESLRDSPPPTIRKSSLRDAPGEEGEEAIGVILVWAPARESPLSIKSPQPKRWKHEVWKRDQLPVKK